MVIANFTQDEKTKYVEGLDQYDYGQVLRIQGLNLPTAVEIHFGLDETGGTTVTRIGTTKDGVTDVIIPDSMLENNDTDMNYSIYAFVYLADSSSGKTTRRIKIQVKARPKPEAFDRPEDAEIFKEAIKAVNESAARSAESEKEAEGWAHGREDLPERLQDNAKYYSEQAREDSKKTDADRKEVERLVESVSGIDEQVTKVEKLTKQAQTSATNSALSEQAAKESENNAAQARVGAEVAEDNAELAAQRVEQDKAIVEQAKNIVKQMGQEVLDNKNLVDKTAQDFDLKAQQAFADVNNAGQAQTERVQTAGNDAVESVKAAQGTATRAVETAKTEAIEAVQTEGTTQAGNVSAEGEKQVQAVRGAAQEIIADREQIQMNKEGVAKLKEDIDSLELRSCGNAKEEGFTICDKDENIGVQIGSKKIWDNLPYNRKYGWGGIPYGNGELPPYSRIAGMFEADMFSVRGGKGRWNGDDTNNFKHGGHLFEGWNKEEDVRLTFGIGLKNKDISWIQTFHPATEEGTDGGAYYGVTKIGSDIDREGVDFMPTVAKSQSIICLKVGNDLVPKREHVQELVDTGELVDWEYSSSDMIPFGAMYFDYNMNKVRVYTKTGWKTLKFEEDI